MHVCAAPAVQLTLVVAKQEFELTTELEMTVSIHVYTSYRVVWNCSLYHCSYKHFINCNINNSSKHW